jgi:pimeloyl-ACP methyl ester carboxylesterase
MTLFASIDRKPSGTLIRLGFAALLLLSAGCSTDESQVGGPPVVQAESRLKRAQKLKLNPEKQAAEYLAVAEICSKEIGHAGVAPASGPNGALALYNEAAADLATNLPKLIGQGDPGTLTLRDSDTGQTYQLRIESDKPGEYKPGSFQQILSAAHINKKGLLQDAVRNGLGGAVVGVEQSQPVQRLQPLKGYRLPLTAIVDLTSFKGKPIARLRLINPSEVDKVDLGGTVYPVAADFSAPVASYGRINEFWIGFLQMIRGERMRVRAGLLMAAPYDPKKIPVVFVHGLLSSPFAWRNLVNSLMLDPEIRRHYQFWVFSYATGNPIAYSALLLRDDLEYAQKTYGFKSVTLIGHSMGGILSRLQVTDFGLDTWRDTFGANANQLYAALPNDSLVKRALLFRANPAVKRVIFVSTPHRGSAIASGGIGALGMRLIQLPAQVVRAVPRSLLEAVNPGVNAKKLRLPTSISNLSPKSPILLAMNKEPIKAPHNSIIGDRGRGDTPNSSDGVVPYWSSHVKTAESELIVPTGHGAMSSPKTVAEIRRILLLDLGSHASRRSIVPKSKTAQPGKASPTNSLDESS